MDSTWQTQVGAFLANHEDITRRRYQDSLAAFCVWYAQTYDEEPDARMLTDEEVRDYRVYLLDVRGYKAATINAYLAPIRSIVRQQGRSLKVKGVCQTQPLIETLDSRDLGRLISAVDSSTWHASEWMRKRDVALINVMARAGLRVSEALALELRDVELKARSGNLLVRRGKGLKERCAPLSVEARSALNAYISVRPSSSRNDALFLSRTFGPLDPRDAQRILSEAARIAGVKIRVTPHTLRHYFATRFLEKNPGNIATLATVLGHANISTTTRYLHPNATQVQEMVEAM
jgi:site-specific recombinase XerD